MTGDPDRPYAWEGGIARQFVAKDEVVELLDVDAYYDGVGRPKAESADLLLQNLASERLIAPGVGGRWNILNLGAILFAKDLGAFEFGLSRKAVRFVAYDGDGRTATVTHRRDFAEGYGVSFGALNGHVGTLIPSPEDNGAVVRQAKPLFPPVAIREVLANALIHQDMTLTGAGPTVELFRTRLEITNPGTPLVATDRFIDSPPRSRNEALASLMRRMGLCEEQGTGIDKVGGNGGGAASAAGFPSGNRRHQGHVVRPQTIRRLDDRGAVAGLLPARWTDLFARRADAERHAARSSGRR